MAKKKPVTKKLLKGRFYAVHEGSPKGHPGKLYWKNDNKNLYLFIKTGTTPSPDNIVLIVPTAKGVKKSYVYKRPVLAKRKDVGSELPSMRFGKPDKKKIREISRMPFSETSSIGRSDRRYVKRLKKKPKY